MSRTRLLMTTLGVVAFFLSGTMPVAALDCGSCGRQGLSALTMFCPDCKALLNQPSNRVKAKKSAVLTVEIYYTGDHPEKLPEYAKLYINRKYAGNIPQTEREARGQSLATPGRSGLGFDYTAKYATELREQHVGMVQVEVEMRFKRLLGVSRSHRRVLFRNVNLKPDEKTVLRQYFDHPTTFSKVKPELSASDARKPGNSFVPEMKTGTGTVSLETPLF